MQVLCLDDQELGCSIWFQSEIKVSLAVIIDIKAGTGT
jgi:hypothetical protein